MARTPVMVAVLCAAVVAVSCGSSDDGAAPGTVGESPTLTELDAATAEAAASAGVVDVALLSAVAGDDTTWEEGSGEIDETDVAECLLSERADPEGGGGEPLAVATSEVIGEDDRGSTTVFVRAISETLAFATEADAVEAFAALDGDHLIDCLVASNEAITSEGDIEEFGASLLEADDVEVEELSSVSGGDESMAVLATFDLDEGEGDDNIDAAALHAVRIGPVVEVVWTTRSGEDQSDNPVQEETAGIGTAVADRVEAIRGVITPAED